ncbi:MAG: hypothetical protein F6K40_16655 [Okeania sp. SIO3I5]|uniref:hypothetical protein n=1 Tax=Okeania sp. SIO3I5 TaxID=2607805 RepID=UPI0013BE58A2|nr:hypothetical protein [Okeania sp. SIO3I5]NEQ37800.1 hypothetical protein [Okeania sp. SIO3I5]
MKRLKLILIACCAALFLGLISSGLNAQEYASCLMTYTEMQEAMSKVAKADGLYNYGQLFYPAKTQSLVDKLKIIYFDPRCSEYQPKLIGSLRAF